MKKYLISLILIALVLLPVRGTVMADVETGEIIKPTVEQIFAQGEILNLEAKDVGAKNGGVQWAIRFETCNANTNTVAGNVDTYNSGHDWKDGIFTANVDTTNWKLGKYCFVFNPNNEDRLAVMFELRDKTPPSAPQNLHLTNPNINCGAVTNSDNITANWDASTDNIGVTEYQYLIKNPENPENGEIASTTATTTNYHFSKGEGTYTFKVRAVDAANNYSDWSNTCSVIYDNTLPIITIHSPVNNAEVSGVVTVKATITDVNLKNYTVSLYQGTSTVPLIATTTNSAGITNENILTFNSKLYTNGNYRIKVKTEDLAGNTEEKEITLTIKNETSIKPPVDPEKPGKPENPGKPEQIGKPSDIAKCQNGGWKTFEQKFKNQGQCISYFRSNEKAGKRK